MKVLEVLAGILGFLGFWDSEIRSQLGSRYESYGSVGWDSGIPGIPGILGFGVYLKYTHLATVRY
jgi:hypothetical protein